MVPRHPLDRLSDDALRTLSIGCLLATAACLAAMLATLPGWTVVDFVEAGSVERARAVAARWSPADRVRIAHAVGLDYLMNPAYLTLAAALCVRAARRRRRARGGRLGPLLAWLAWAGVGLNALENVGILLGTLGRSADPWPALALAAHYWNGAVLCAGFVYWASGPLARPRSA